MKQIEYNSILNQLSQNNNSEIIRGGELLSPQQTIEMLNFYNNDFLFPANHNQSKEDYRDLELQNYERDMKDDHRLIINSVVSPDL